MKKLWLILGLAAFLTGRSYAQKLDASKVPEGVRAALVKKYPAASKVTWEKENGNFEANWGGKSGEDHTAKFSPAGEFVEYGMAIPLSQLPANIAKYVNSHYSQSRITEALKITSADGTVTYEAEVKGKDLLFDSNGNFIKISDGD